MRWILIRLVSIATIAVFLTGCTSQINEALNQIAQGSDNGTAVEPELPFWPYAQECGDMYKVSMPVSGITDRGAAYAWLTLSEDGTDKIVSEPVEVSNGQFVNQKIVHYFDASELPEGTYQMDIYLTENLSDVGDKTKRLTAAGPYSLSVDYSLVQATYCIDRIALGDSVYFVADSIESPFYEEGYIWQIYAGENLNYEDHFEVQSVVGNVSEYFVKLDNNLFMPLKMSQLDVNNEDSIKWELTFIRDRGSDADTETVELIVVPPTSLGFANPEYDQYITLWSDYFGVPPQIVKAIIHKESKPTFDPNSYRYEMDFDHNWMQPALHNNAHYERYLLADSVRTGQIPGFDRYGNTVSQGDSVAGLAYDPYQILKDYSINNPVTVVDDNADGLISAWELASHNNRFNTTQSDFVSQLLLSASHGLMQPMQVSLIDYVGFGSRDPQELYGDQSRAIYWGVNNLQDIYYDSDVVDPSYSWDDRWRTAIGMYNGGRGAGETYGDFDNNNIDAYVNLVLQHINEYQPEL